MKLKQGRKTPFVPPKASSSTLGLGKFLAGLLLCLAGFSSPAQWLTQTNVIKPGWTAVYLCVDASSQPILPAATGVPLSPSNPIDQIWMWKYPASTAQYIDDPESPFTGGGQWATWAIDPTNGASTLAELVPNSAYLIHSAAATNYTWKVQGQPVPPSYTWDMTGLNFIGFDTPYANPPSFQNYLAQDPAISSVVQIFQYVGGPFSGLNPQLVFSQYATPVTRGQAFWVSATNVNNSYFGPFNLTLPNPSGLNFGSSVGQFTIHLVNTTTNTLTVSANLLPSETPPVGQTNIVGPPPLLLEGAENTANLTFAYTPLPVGTPQSWTLAPAGQSGSDVAVVIGINRFALTSPPGSLYAGFLQFTDSLGFSEVDVPVTAASANNAGLWVGKASISQVGGYLKSYGTNADGSYQEVPMTNAIYSTNFSSSLVVTDQFISGILVSNEYITHYRATNWVVNSYVTNGFALSSNGVVAFTNLIVNTLAVSNVIITTTETGFTLSGSTIIWQTASVTNQSGTALISTNFVVGTNSIAAVHTNNTPVVVTGTVFSYLTVSNTVTTNGLFMNPVTNLVFSSVAANSTFLSTNLARNTLVTNPFVLTTTNGFYQTNNYVLTNFASMPGLSTNFVATNTALAVITNGTTEVIVVPAYYKETYGWQVEPVFSTNFFVISNNFVLVAGVTNFAGSTTNQLSGSSVAGTITSGSASLAYTIPFLVTNSTFSITSSNSISVASKYVISSLNTNLGAVVTPYPLRLILFNDGTNATLMQRVYYGIRNNTNVVVATTESVLDVNHLDTARRITSTSMPWTANNTVWPCAGQLALGGALNVTVTDTYDDQAANPFLHTYHPDHNNLDLSQNPPRELPQGSQSFGLSRAITLTVAPNASDFISLTTANSSLAGIYQETTTLTGLGGATRTFTSAGTFTLTRVSPISVLTTQ